MKESERLKAARALIADEKNWMQGAYANAEWWSGEARQFCSVAAVHMARDEDWHIAPNNNSTSAYLKLALGEIGSSFVDIASFNDNEPHSRILEMFDKAIELAEAEGC